MGNLGSPDPLGIWVSRSPFPKAPETTSPAPAPQEPKRPWQCKHLELHTRRQLFVPQNPRFLGPWTPPAVTPQHPESCFVPGLAVGCRQHPVWGDEGGTAVEASALEEGHLPRLGVGHTLLTSRRLAVVLLGRWERARRGVSEGGVPFLASRPRSAFFTCAFPKFLKRSLPLTVKHCLLSSFYNCCWFSAERLLCPGPPAFATGLWEREDGERSPL